MMKSIFLAAAIALGASQAFAQTTSMQSANPAPKGKDPNRKICEKVEKTGTRLGVVTVCMTAEQWEQQRRDHRNDVERAQQNVGIKTEG